ncbi:MAG TPA: PfkB family carbohydrate kinase [Caulobacterales bacterium]|nr:PfkB family carbohydrate kinase [Caulobacterales bacterium]
MRIAVVVPCQDRLASLGLCLGSIARAVSALDGEVDETRTIVVNDRSKPGFAAALAQRFSWVEVIDAEGVGPGAARNTGLHHADADLYLLTDSDCVVAEDWCVRARDWCAGRRAPMAQGIPWLYQKTRNPPLGACEEQLYAHMFASYTNGETTSMIDPRCMLIARDYFEHHSRDVFATWIADASYEDRAVIGALIGNGLRIDWRPEIRVFHEDPPDALGVWRQKYRHGAGRVYRWPEPPEFEFLLERYFLAPLREVNDRGYVIPAHIAFLLGYRDSLRRRNPQSRDWWRDFVEALRAKVHDADDWLAPVEAAVCAPSRESNADAKRVAGYGVIAADHVFVADKSGQYRYHGSRGGGTVWNVLAHLSQSGSHTFACGTCASDGPGDHAMAELRWLGVDTSGLIVPPGTQSPIFTQWLNQATRHGAEIPQGNFTTECPICLRAPEASRLAILKGDGERPQNCALVCVDRLTPETISIAAGARAAGVLSALDLGGVPAHATEARPALLEGLARFDLVAMPAGVAAALCGRSVEGFVEKLMADGVAALALTRGQAGFDLAVRTDDQGIVRRTSAAPELETVADATGAGDAFIAALLGLALDPSIADRADGRLTFRADALDTLVAGLKTAPSRVLSGVGARAGLADHPALTKWGSRLTPLRGLTLDSLRQRFGETRPCWFCDVA